MAIAPSSNLEIDLFAAGVADPHNIAALQLAATMHKGHLFQLNAKQTGCFSLTAIRRDYHTILALDNIAGAGDLLSYRPTGEKIALFVGNEKRGLPANVLRSADRVLQIPMAHPAASLNVAGAGAAALWQLHHAIRRQPPAPGYRPELVFAHPANPAHLGSALRAAWALGWEQVGLIDSHGSWFTTSRTAYAEGRGAARRHKNPLHVYNWQPANTPTAFVISHGGDATPLWRAALPMRGRYTLIIPDGEEDIATELASSGVHVLPVSLGLNSTRHNFHLLATIALVEVARRLRIRR